MLYIKNVIAIIQMSLNLGLLQAPVMLTSFKVDLIISSFSTSFPSSIAS